MMFLSDHALDLPQGRIHVVSFLHHNRAGLDRQVAQPGKKVSDVHIGQITAYHKYVEFLGCQKLQGVQSAPCGDRIIARSLYRCSQLAGFLFIVVHDEDPFLL